MRTIRNQHFENDSVTLDGTEFIECDFVNCEIGFSGGEVHLNGSTMKGCRWKFDGAARNTIGILRGFGIVKGDPSAWPVIPQTPDTSTDF